MEVYPTRVRDSAMGFLTFISRISGFISNFVTIIIIPIWTSWIFYFSLVVSFFGLIVTCLLPFLFKYDIIIIFMNFLIYIIIIINIVIFSKF